MDHQHPNDHASALHEPSSTAGDPLAPDTAFEINSGPVLEERQSPRPARADFSLPGWSKTGDTALADRAIALLWAGVAFAAMWACGGIGLISATHHLSHARHAVGPLVGIAGISVLVWYGLYLQLLKRLADRIEEALDDAGKPESGNPPSGLSHGPSNR